MALPAELQQVPYDCGLVLGAHVQSIDHWCRQYLESGQHWLDWQQRMAERQEDLMEWEASCHGLLMQHS